MLEMLTNYFIDTGFYQFHWSNGVMIGIGLLFIYLAVKKGFEPLLLVPIGFGVLIGNIPYDVMKLNVGVYDGPTTDANISYYTLDVASVDLKRNDEGLISYERAIEIINDERATARLAPLTPDSYAGLMAVMSRGQVVNIVPGSIELIPYRSEALELVDHGKAVLVNTHSVLTMDPQVEAPAFVEFRQGRMAFIPPLTAPMVEDESDLDPVSAEPIHEPLGHLPPADEGKYAELWSLEKQDTWNAGVFWMIFRGIEFGFFPPLIFLGIGALTDFGPLLAQPRTFLLGAAAQLGIFGALLLALLVGFDGKEAASIGIIGGADGPTSIFVCTKLAPDLLGAVALSAYSYMAMVPIIQPPIIRLLTTKAERTIRMDQPKEVSKTLKIMFPVVAFLLTAFIAPGGLALLGMLFFGNLLRESMVTDRLAKTAGGVFIDIVTILLGVAVGAKTSASTFLTIETIWIFVLGIVAFSVSTAGGVLFGKVMCYMSGRKINPMIGAAGVSAVPMAARVVQRVAHEEDPHNFLLMHAMGPNVAGVIGSAVAAGVLLSYFAG